MKLDEKWCPVIDRNGDRCHNRLERLPSGAHRKLCGAHRQRVARGTGLAIPLGEMPNGKASANGALAAKLGHCIHQYPTGYYCSRAPRDIGYCGGHASRFRQGRDMDAPWATPACGLGGYQRGCRCETCKTAKSETDKEYHRKNRDRVLAQQKKFREANPEKISEGKKKCYYQKRDQYLARAKEYRLENPDKVKEQHRRYYKKNAPKMRAKSREWSSNNKERVRQTSRARHENNKDQAAEYAREYRRRNPNVATRALKRQDQRESAIPKIRGRQPWTVAEDATVTREDITIIEMAALTGRSAQAIRARRHILRNGVVRRSVHRPWSAEEDSVVLNYSVQDAAEILQRSLSSVKNRRFQLRRRLK